MSLAMGKCVGLLSGGHASEHEISLRTSATLRNALLALGHCVSEMVIAVDGTWNELPQPLGTRPCRVDSICADACWHGSAAEGAARWFGQGVRCVVLGLHGQGGEDGTIQGFLEHSGFAYTGSGVAASAVALDKILCKHLMRSAEIPTPRWSVLTAGEHDGAAQRIIADHGLPVVLKAVGLGSSVGVFVCRDPSAVQDALNGLAAEPMILVEEFVKGREFSVPVLGSGEQARALPAIDIVPKLGDFFDLASKYTPGGAEEICPARTDEPTAQALAASALALHRIIGARGVTRTDILQREDGSLGVLEINTLPGMTAESLVPRSAAVAGLSMPQLVQCLLEDAMAARALAGR